MSYLMFNVAVPLASPDEWQWLRTMLQVVRHGTDQVPRFLLDFNEPDALDEQGFDVDLPTEAAPDGSIGQAMFYTVRESDPGDPDKLAHLLRKFLREFHPDRALVITWSEAHYDAVPNQCGGGAMVVTADSVTEMSTGVWAQNHLDQNGLAVLGN